MASRNSANEAVIVAIDTGLDVLIEDCQLTSSSPSAYGCCLRRNDGDSYRAAHWSADRFGGWVFSSLPPFTFINRHHLFSLLAAPNRIERRQSFSLVTATRACEISRIFQMTKMLSSMVNGWVRPIAKFQVAAIDNDSSLMLAEYEKQTDQYKSGSDISRKYWKIDGELLIQLIQERGSRVR